MGSDQARLQPGDLVRIERAVRATVRIGRVEHDAGDPGRELELIVGGIVVEIGLCKPVPGDAVPALRFEMHLDELLPGEGAASFRGGNGAHWHLRYDGAHLLLACRLQERAEEVVDRHAGRKPVRQLIARGEQIEQHRGTAHRGQGAGVGDIVIAKAGVPGNRETGDVDRAAGGGQILAHGEWPAGFGAGAAIGMAWNPIRRGRKRARQGGDSRDGFFHRRDGWRVHRGCHRCRLLPGGHGGRTRKCGCLQEATA